MAWKKGLGFILDRSLITDFERQHPIRETEVPAGVNAVVSPNSPERDDLSDTLSQK